MKRTSTKRMRIAFLACIIVVLSGCSVSVKTAGNSTISTDEEALSFGGGNPWIDSNLKCNIIADAKLSPKDDFYLYKNYEWLLTTDLDKDKYQYSAADISQEKTNEKAMLLLDDDTLISHDAQLVHSLNNALLDWDARNEAGLEPVMKTVQDIQNIKNLEELSDFICDPERSLFVPVFLRFENQPAFDDADRYILNLETDSFTLSDAAEYTDRTELGDRYYKANVYLAKAMLTRLGYDEAEAEQLFSDKIALEGKIAEKSMTSSDKMSPDYDERTNNIYSSDEISKLTISFPLSRMLKGCQYDDAESYMVLEPEAVKRIDELYTEKNLNAIKAYMMIGYLNTISDFLDRESYDARTKSRNIIYGSSGSQEYKKAALNIIRQILPTPISRLYLEKYDQSEKKERITKICEDVVKTYRKMLKEEDWLSTKTKNKAIEKLDAIKIHTVYPEKWEDYSGLNINGLSLYDQLAEITKYKRALDRAKTNGTVDPQIWDIGCDILTSNAFYDASYNSIYILLGMLDEPYYYDGVSEEALLGSIGTGIIGHEISHAFDAGGSQYDKDGNLVNWWTEEDRKMFTDRTDKLIKYFNDITAWDGQSIVGENIQGEAIADIAGMKVILQFVKGRDDFDYDAFFTAYAESWKTIDTPEAEAAFVTQDPHPLYYLRVNTTLQQFDEFYNTYDIKEGDNMYLAPEDRVSVW